ncbi:hypothetical protein AAAK29_25910 [Mesorhizobium sp. CCNWLW179-1]|uniref:hypothetical protein n=1 Tax=unclassified Mesorhizobium TaxID=325217 RepID=UPI0030152541
MEREWWRNSKSTALLRKIAKKIKRDGIVGSAMYLGRGAFRLADLRNSPRAGESAFDRSYGTDTDGIIPLWKLHIASRNRDAGSRCRQYLKCRAVASFYGDAAIWEFLQENMVIFLYNPFDDSVLIPVLENLRRSIIDGFQAV